MASLVIDARMIDASGIGAYLQNLIPFLVKCYQTYLIGNPKQLSRYGWATDAVTIPSTASIYSLQEQVELYRKIPVCDIFWSPHYNIPLLPVPARKRIVTIHDAYHLAYRHTLSLPQKLFASIFLRAAATRSEKIITVSEFSRQEISRYTNTSPASISVIYNGVDQSKFRILAKEQAKQQLKEFYPELPQNFMLYVGNVKPHKNLMVLLQAFALLEHESPLPCSLVIVGKREGFITGDNQLAVKLQEDNRLKEKVYFTGFVQEDHLPLIYNSASLFVFPSLYEGFGLPPVEAMACGCPVVASHAASIPEICGEAAEYFDPLDPHALAQQLQNLFADEIRRNELTERGLQQVQKYSWQTAAEKHIQLFEELLNQS